MDRESVLLWIDQAFRELLSRAEKLTDRDLEQLRQLTAMMLQNLDKGRQPPPIRISFLHLLWIKPLVPLLPELR